jgi:uncharacterized sporulation protein YeaH/YhbH (DUF444 family)
MTRGIDGDLDRFRKIVRGKARDSLRKYISQGEMLGRQGRNVVTIPVPRIDIPHFRHGKKGSGGTGQGDGDIGQSIGSSGDPADGAVGGAGSEPGSEHFREVEVTLEELATMLGEVLELPRIEPKGRERLRTERDKYNTIRRRGPESLRHPKRSYKRALKRMISAGLYNPDDPVVIPERDDRVYRGANTVVRPESNAVIVYVMDVSGSMTDEQKTIVRTEAFWIDTWLRSQYDGVEIRYIIHDAVAKEVDEETFYHTRESGGTRISSAYKVARDLLAREFPAADWNIYVFQFSDGDNWGEDNPVCLELLRDHLLPVCNAFCYGQVESPYGTGEFVRELRKIEERHENLILSEIADKSGILYSIRTFLGKGR